MTAADYNSLVDEVIASKAEAVVYATDATQVNLYLIAATQAGYNGNLLLGNASEAPDLMNGLTAE